MTSLLAYTYTSGRSWIRTGPRMAKQQRRQRLSSLASSSLSEDTSSSSQRHDASASSASSEQPFFPIYYNDVYKVVLPPNHRFPMEKYGKVRRMVQQQLNCDDDSDSFRVSPLSTIDELATTHCRDYIHRHLTGDQSNADLRNVGFPWSEQGVKRSLSSVGGTVAAACAVCEELDKNGNNKNGTTDDATTNNSSGIQPWGAHVAGGTHHAFYDRGEGFCIFSDIAVAANVVLQKFPHLVQRVLILDLDVHQGNGNAVLFQDTPEVFTFSMHCAANYFSAKQESDLDIELPAECNDETYLMTLQHWLSRLKRQDAGPFDMIFFQAGVDILEADRLGRMSLSSAGVERRNQLVYEFAHALNVPLIITMGGGYPRTDDWTPIIDAHANVYIQAHQFLSQVATEQAQDAATSA